jgi:hypothetical protein
MRWYRRATVTLLAVPVALGVVSCSRGIAGTPVAAPGPPLLATTCRDYAEMTPAARREVITAIGGAGNKLVATNPDLWTGVAAALCTFASPSAPVKDVVTGGIR